MTRQNAPQLARDPLQLLLPVLGVGRGKLHFGDDAVEDELQELVLGAHVPVERQR
jgi:hypothetical protein